MSPLATSNLSAGILTFSSIFVALLTDFIFIHALSRVLFSNLEFQPCILIIPQRDSIENPSQFYKIIIKIKLSLLL
jgi:hypothetical protein